jgi:hypothetical protein
VANEPGEILTTWQQAEGEERGLCRHSVAVVAIGSPTAGFTDMGTISTLGKLSFSTGAFLDDAGDAWVVGVNEHYQAAISMKQSMKGLGHGSRFDLRAATSGHL